MTESIFIDPQEFANEEIVNYHRERRRNQRISAGSIAFAPVGAVAGGLDTIGQSLGIVDDQDFERFFNGLNENAGDMYKRNKVGYRFAGDVASMFVGAGAASKLLRSGGMISSVLQKGGSVGRAIDRTVSINQSRVDDLVQEYAKFSEVVGSNAAPGTTTFAHGRKLRSQARLATAANDLRGGLAAEAFIFGAMSESELFFPEGQKTSDMVYMSAAGLGLGGALGQLFITPALKRAGGRAAREALERGDIISDDAGLDLVTASKIIDETSLGVPVDILADAPELQGTFNNLNSAAQNNARKATEQLTENSPLGGMSSNVTVTQGVVDTVLDVARGNDKMIANTLSIETGDTLSDFVNKSAAAVKKLEKQRDELKASQADAANDALRNKLNGELIDIDTQIKNLQGDAYAVRVSSVGNLSTNPNQPTIFDGGKVKVSKVNNKVKGAGNEVFYASEGSKDTTLGVTTDGRIVRGNKQISTTAGLSVREMTKPYAAMARAQKNLSKTLADDSIIVKSRHKITKNSNHMTFDYIIEAAKRLNLEDDLSPLDKMFDTSEFGTLSALKKASLDAKLKEFGKLKAAQLKALKSGQDLYNSESIGAILNLKFSDNFNSNNYSLQWFEDLYRAGKKTVGNDYVEAMEDFKQHLSLGSTKGTSAHLLAEKGTGIERLIETDLFKRLKNPQEPLTFIVSKSGRVDNSMFDTHNLIDIKKRHEQLRENELGEAVRTTAGAEMFGQIDDALINSPMLTKAMRDGSKVISQDAVDQPLFDKFGQLTPFSLNYLLRGVEGADSAGIIADIWQRQAKVFAANELKNNTKAMNKLRVKGNEESAARFLHYHSAMQQGWVLADNFVESGRRIKLEPENKKNKKIAEQMGLKQVPEFMPDPVARNGVPLIMDELSLAALAEVRRFSDMRWSMDNVLAKHLGRSGLQYRNGHTIEPSRYGKEMVFITDEFGKVVDYITEGNIVQGKKLANQRIAELMRQRSQGDQLEVVVNGKTVINEGEKVPVYNEKGNGVYGIVTRDEVGKYKQAHQQAWNSAYIDISDSWKQTSGKKEAGGRSGLYTNTDFIDGQLLEISEMFEESGRKFIATKFSGMLENVKNLQRVANVQKQGLRNFVTGEAGVAFDDAYDMFTNQLLNTSTRHEGSLYGSLGMTIEHIFDTTVGKMFDGLHSIPKTGGKKGNAAMQAAYEKLAKETGFDPAEYAIRMAERGMGEKMPPNMLKVMRGAASFTQSMALKFFEVGHAALTSASIATTVPHNVEWMRRNAGESVEAFKSRVGVAGDLLDDDFAVPNGSKLAMTTVMKHLKGEYNDVIGEASKLGYLDSQIAEFVNELTAPRKTALGRGAKKFGDFAGLVSGKSEDYARTISFLTGYEMFSKQGKINPKMAMALSNDFANKVIADYRPHQRAEVFKGATGIPLAMFQTFAINYFQRLLQNVENKQWKALATQYGTQAFVFGGSSVPGFEFINEKVLETWDEKARPEDLVRDGFGKGLSDVLLYGTLGNLPKLLGADDGLAFHTRGEMSVPRNITFGNFTETPVAQLVARSGSAMLEGFKAATSNGDVGGRQRLQESLIYAIPNRPVKGLLEYAQGYSTNRRGEIINDEISGLYKFAQQVSGLKALRDADKAAALWRDQETQMSQRSSMSRLSASVEAGMRAGGVGNFSSGQIQTVMERYFANGGSPRGFKRWYRERLMRSQYSRSDRALLRALGQGDRGQDILRFAD